ncbi:hypothetical protein [Actinomadura sp. CNU-125]|uniref:hypothetical protein n=1 Tax=Actinomadura sp. CNU-125 TaxID=1904961 RepID=UPI0021CC7466|nr:hypothetical protein [Actinomadura sp. CNU-125]
MITLCDKAREDCPEFDDRTRLVHWSIPDPVAAGGGSERGALAAFVHTTSDIDTRVRHLLPVLARPPEVRP